MPRMAVLLCVCVGLAIPTIGGSEVKPDAAVKPAVEKFFTAMKAKDMDALLKAVDIPWFHDGRRILREQKDLKAEFEQLLKSKELAELKYEIKQIIPYKEVRNELDNTTRNLGDEVLDAKHDDSVVLLTVSNPNPEKLVLLVRVRKGEAKIVGLQN